MVNDANNLTNIARKKCANTIYNILQKLNVTVQYISICRGSQETKYVYKIRMAVDMFNNEITRFK